MLTSINDILEINEKELDSNSNSVVNSDMNDKTKNQHPNMEDTKEHERKCLKCKKVFPLFDEHGKVSFKFFGKNVSSNTGGWKYWRTDCNWCYKDMGKNKSKAKTKYAKENNIFKKNIVPTTDVCELTGRKAPVGKTLVFDHCDTKLVFRGWLHDSPNRAIGMLKDQDTGSDVIGLVKAVNYCNTTEGLSFSINDKGEIEVNEK